MVEYYAEEGREDWENIDEGEISEDQPLIGNPYVNEDEVIDQVITEDNLRIAQAEIIAQGYLVARKIADEVYATLPPKQRWAFDLYTPHRSINIEEITKIMAWARSKGGPNRVKNALHEARSKMEDVYISIRDSLGDEQERYALDLGYSTFIHHDPTERLEVISRIKDGWDREYKGVIGIRSTHEEVNKDGEAIERTVTTSGILDLPPVSER